MQNANSILLEIERNMPVIKDFGVKKIGLFGSFARGEQTDSSDIDIVIEFRKNQKTFDNYMDLKFFLEDLLDRKVGLIISEAIKPHLKASITRSIRYAQGF